MEEKTREERHCGDCVHCKPAAGPAGVFCSRRAGGEGGSGGESLPRRKKVSKTHLTLESSCSLSLAYLPPSTLAFLKFLSFSNQVRKSHYFVCRTTSRPRPVHCSVQNITSLCNLQFICRLCQYWTVFPILALD